jgi:hypothetical protein
VNGTGVRGYSASGWGGTFNNNTSGRYTVVIRNNTGAGSPGLYVDGYITKTGAVNFVVPHPTDPAKEIVYACLEGPEAGTYCRGEGTLVNGVAVLDLPDHFSLVTNEKGITVQVTPTAECNGVFVAKYDNKQITVKELGGGKSNATFHWLVNGVRKGYENYQVIREKGQHRLPEVAPASKEKPDEKEK